jgi:hypothetical protein
MLMGVTTQRFSSSGCSTNEESSSSSHPSYPGGTPIGHFLRALKERTQLHFSNNNFYPSPVVVKYAVLSVPVWYDDDQRRAFKFAGKVGGLEVIRLPNESTGGLLGCDGDDDVENGDSFLDLGRDLGADLDGAGAHIDLDGTRIPLSATWEACTSVVSSTVSHPHRSDGDGLRAGCSRTLLVSPHGYLSIDPT